MDYVTSQGPGSRNLHVADHDNKRGCLPSPWAFWTPGILFTQMSVEGLAATTELTNRLLGQLLFGTGWEIPYKMNNWLSCLWRSTGPGADPNVLLCTGTMEAALQRSSYDPQNRGSAQLLFQAGRASREHICQNPHTSPRECVQILSGVPLQCEELFGVLTSLELPCDHRSRYQSPLFPSFILWRMTRYDHRIFKCPCFVSFTWKPNKVLKKCL